MITFSLIKYNISLWEAKVLCFYHWQYKQKFEERFSHILCYINVYRCFHHTHNYKLYTDNQLSCVTSLFPDLLPKNWFATTFVCDQALIRRMFLYNYLNIWLVRCKIYLRQWCSSKPCKISPTQIKMVYSIRVESITLYVTSSNKTGKVNAASSNSVRLQCTRVSSCDRK